MALFLVEHVHTPDKCPRRSPSLVGQLAEHLTKSNAENYGVKIVADWVNEDQHTVVLILEAHDQVTVAKYVAPFATVGSIIIREGTTCAEIAREGSANQKTEPPGP